MTKHPVEKTKWFNMKEYTFYTSDIKTSDEAREIAKQRRKKGYYARAIWDHDYAVFKKDKYGHSKLVKDGYSVWVRKRDLKKKGKKK